MNMKTLVLFKYSVLFLCLCGIHLNGFAQSTREAILEDIARTGGVYYAYPVKEAIATPPPKGYKTVLYQSLCTTRFQMDSIGTGL